MSRSYRAWSEICASPSIVGGAGEQGGLEDRARRGQKPLLGAVSSIKCLLQSLLVAVLIAAAVLAGSARGAQAKSPTTKSPTTDIQQQRSSHPDPAGRPVVLVLGSGYFSRDGAARVRVLQRRLVTAGFSPGPLDGRYGPLTEGAVERFQASRGLQVDGIAGPLTLAALRSTSTALYPGAGYVGLGSGRVRVLQRRLVRAGFSPGPVDGRYGPLTDHAVRRFQAAHGLPASGIADSRTLATLGRRQPTDHNRTHRSRPASSYQGAHRSSRRGDTQPGRAPAPRPAPPAAHSPSSPPLGLVVALIAVAVVALALAGWWFVDWRPTQRDRTLDATLDGLSPPGHAGASAAEVNPPTTPDPPAPDPAAPTASTPDGASTVVDPGPVEEPAAGASAFDDGMLLEQHGDQQGAIGAYQRADRLGHPGAAANLGVLLEGRSERTAAEAAYRRAEERGDADGAFNLALLLGENGDPAGAFEAYQRADRLGHPAAAANLGVLLEEHGERAAAEAAYRRAEQRGDATGAFNLAVLLEGTGDHARALGAYQRARRLGDPEIAQLARAAESELSKPARRTRTGGNHDDH